MLYTKKDFEAARRTVQLLHLRPERMIGELASMEKAREGVTREQREDWLRKNWNNKQEYGSAVLYTVEKDVLAHPFGLSFFQLESLGEGDWPIIDQYARDGNLRCWYIGQNYGRPKHQFVPRREHVQHLLKRYTTDEVEFKLTDLQIGRVDESERVQREMAYELNLAINAEAKTLLDAAVLASGLRDTLALHKSIVAANIPDANYLDLSGVGTANKLNPEKLKRILDYFVRFASDVELDGQPLRIGTIYMSSVNMRDIWDMVSLVAAIDGGTGVEDPKDTIPENMREGIYQSGTLNRLFGQPVNLVSRNTIAEGDLYVSSNKPVGYYFTKPSMSETNRTEDRKKNKGSMDMTVVHAMVIPDEWTYRFVKVQL